MKKAMASIIVCEQYMSGLAYIDNKIESFVIQNPIELHSCCNKDTDWTLLFRDLEITITVPRHCGDCLTFSSDNLEFQTFIVKVDQQAQDHVDKYFNVLGVLGEFRVCIGELTFDL